MIKALEDEVKNNHQKHTLQIGKKVSLTDLKLSTVKVDQKINKLQNEINALSLRVVQAQNKLIQFQTGNLIPSKPELGIPPAKPSIETKSWVDPGCSDFDNFLFNGSAITATKQYVAAFGKNKIEGKYTFTATFSKIGDIVQLGVYDISNKNGFKNNKKVYYRNNSYCIIQGSGSYKGNGFKTGEKVTVAIDIKQGFIQWRVGSDIRHQETVEFLKDNSITWVPWIHFCNKDDSVEISEE